MKNRLIILVAVMMAFALALAGCGAPSADEGGNGGDGVTEVRMATGGTSGTYYAYGGIISQVLNDKLDNVNVTIHSSGASKTNIYEIVDGEAEMALVQNDVIHYAYNGTDLFAADGAETDFSAMAAMYAEVCQIVASPDITSIDQLKGKRVSVGDAGSGVEFNTRQILEAYGISFDDIEVQNLSFENSAEALKDGKIDAFFCTAGAPTTAITQLATSNSINVLSVDDEHAAILMESYPFYAQYAIPAGTYNGVDEDVMTVAVKATFIVANDLPEDVVYDMTKAIFENKDEIAAAYAKGEEIDPAYAVSSISVPFHPGAEKYFKEIGAIQ